MTPLRQCLLKLILHQVVLCLSTDIPIYSIRRHNNLLDARSKNIALKLRRDNLRAARTQRRAPIMHLDETNDDRVHDVLNDRRSHITPSCTHIYAKVHIYIYWMKLMYLFINSIREDAAQ